MADYGLGLTPPISPPPGMGGGMIDNPAYPSGSSGGMGTGIPQENPPSQTETPSLGLGATAPAAPNGGASGGAGGGSFTPGQGLNWQGASPADLYGQFQSLDPGLQQSYINYYMNNLDPTQQANWRQAFGQDQPALGAANPQMGNDASGWAFEMGAAPAGQSYSSLMGDATNYYLSHGGTQQNVDAYKAAHPQQDYGQLFNDAAGWYSQQPEYLNLDPTLGTTPIASYFAAHNPPGSPYNQGDRLSSGPGLSGSAAGGTGTPPPSTGMGGTQPPASPAQPGMGGSTPAQPQMGLGAGPSRPPSPGAPVGPGGLGSPPPPGYQIGNYNNAPGGAGTVARAQADPGDYWRQHMNDSVRAGANQGEYAPGSGVPGKDPWLAPSHQMNNGQTQYGKGYHAGQSYQSEPIKDPRTGQPLMVNGQPYTQTLGGGPIKWDQEEGPGKGYTEAGRQEMRQPFTIGGQTFQNGLKPFLNFMRTSSPREQALKGKLGSFDEAGGSLETGERTLFDTLAPYLAQGSLKMPASGTPFTDWNPVGLIDALRKSGLLT